MGRDGQLPNDSFVRWERDAPMALWQPDIVGGAFLADGIGGFFEPLLAPRVLRGIYADELTRLDGYAKAQATGSHRKPSPEAYLSKLSSAHQG